MIRFLSLFLLYFALNSCSEDLNFKSISNTELTQPEQLTLFIFMSPECPLCENYTKDIQTLSEKYSSDSLQIYGVFSGEKLYPKERIIKFKNDYHLSIPFIFDGDYSIAKHFKAQVTPECFLVDTKGKLIYSGKYDNWLEKLGRKRRKISKHFVEDAIISFFNNTEIETKKTEAIGCLLQY